MSNVPNEITQEQAGYLIATTMHTRFLEEEIAALQVELENAVLSLYQAWVMATDSQDKTLAGHCAKGLAVAQNALNVHLLRRAREKVGL